MPVHKKKTIYIFTYYRSINNENKSNENKINISTKDLDINSSHLGLGFQIKPNPHNSPKMVF